MFIFIFSVAVTTCFAFYFISAQYNFGEWIISVIGTALISLLLGFLFMSAMGDTLDDVSPLIETVVETHVISTVDEDHYFLLCDNEVIINTYDEELNTYKFESVPRSQIELEYGEEPHVEIIKYRRENETLQLIFPYMKNHTYRLYIP